MINAGIPTLVSVTINGKLHIKNRVRALRQFADDWENICESDMLSCLTNAARGGNKLDEEHFNHNKSLPYWKKERNPCTKTT